MQHLFTLMCVFIQSNFGQGKCCVQSPMHSHLHRLSLDPSLSKIKLSSYHDRDCKIAVASLLGIKERAAVSI